MTHPSVYSFVFIRSDCEHCSRLEQETDGAVSFIRSKTRRAVQALQLLVCSLCLCVSCSLHCFQVSCQKGAGSGQCLLRKPFLKELRSMESRAADLPSAQDQRSEENGRKKRITLTSFPVPSRPVFGEQDSYTRGFRAVLSAANSRWERAADASHQTPQSLSWMSSRLCLTTVTTYLSAWSMYST